MAVIAGTTVAAEPSESSVAPAASGAAGPSLDTSDGNDLGAMVDRANASVAAQGMDVRPLTAHEFLGWYADQREVTFEKVDRSRWDAYLADGRLPPEVTLETVDFAPTDGVPDRIEVRYPMAEAGWTFGATVMQGDRLYLVEDYVKDACLPDASGYTPCTERFESALPSRDDTPWPSSIPLRVTEARASGQPMAKPGHFDILTVEVQVTPSNRADIAHALVGFDPVSVEAGVDDLLTEHPEGAWVELQELLGGWLADKVGTFPLDGDNDVCFGPARQLYQAELRNGGYDRSTEPIAKVLKDDYTLLPDDAEPRFGDVLNLVGKHAGRFIARDPASGRWIGFSVQSGGNAPYRFWWVDEDFSGAPFDRVADSDGVRERVDVWRRSRPGG
ncbi:MAG: hypothetical protein U0667_10990 [Chloroflexota bacterium]